MSGTVAERRRADFDIPAPLPRACSHIRGADVGGSAISWGQWWFGARGFEADAVNWVLDPFVAERFLLPLRLRSATAHVWTHVLICVEANFPPAPARVRPRMCERTLRIPVLSVSSEIAFRSTLRDLTLIQVMTWSWWRHQMETFSALPALCAGNSSVTGDASFDVIFYQRLNKWLSKQSWDWWFEDLRRHCAHYGVIVMVPRDISYYPARVD